MRRKQVKEQVSVRKFQETSFVQPLPSSAQLETVVTQRPLEEQCNVANNPAQQQTP